MNIERCDRCGEGICTGKRERRFNAYVLCNQCRADIEKMEDRLCVLEGFIEEVVRMAQPVVRETNHETIAGLPKG